MEKFIPQNPFTENKEKRLIRTVIDQANFDEEPMYSLVLEYEETKPGAENRIKTIKLRSPEGQETDLAELTGVEINGPNSVQIRCLTESQAKKHYAGNYNDRSKSITMVGMPDKPHVIAVLLHELAHAKQFADQSLEKLTSLYDECLYGVMGMDSLDAPHRYLLMKIAAAVPEGEELMQDPDLQEYMKVLDKTDTFEKGMEANYDQRQALSQKLTELEKKYVLKLLAKIASPEYRKATVEYRQLRKELGVLMEQWEKMLNEELPAVGKKLNIRRFRFLPVIMLERDANAQAFAWMNTLKDKGIDLFNDFKIEEDGHLFVENAQSFLENGLRVHERSAGISSSRTW